METREINLIIGKSGGTAGKGAKTYKVSLPSVWINELNITEDNRILELTFDGEKIVIQPKKTTTESHKIFCHS